MRVTIALLILSLCASHIQAKSAEIKTGAFEAVFTERCPESSLQNIFKRMQHKPQTNSPLGNDYRIGEESFSVYVPPAYDANVPHGLLLWISAGDGGGMPKGWEELMDRRKLIWIGANRAGNGHSVPGRRMPLALDAVHNAEKTYNIDPNRVYTSGLSGGGRVASVLAIHYPDIFSGGIFVVGAECWELIPVTGKPGRAYKPMPRPPEKYLAMARQRGRYVLLTGDNDFNRQQTKDYYDHGYKKKLEHVLYMQVPEMGHQMPPAEWYEKAIIFLDTAKQKK